MKFAAIVTNKVLIPGDERSRKSPGHGYPAHTVEHLEIVEFDSKEAMAKWVGLNTTGFQQLKFRLIEYNDLSYEHKISVIIK